MFKIETVKIDPKPYLEHQDYQYESPASAAILHMISCQGKFSYIGSGAFGTVYGSSDSNIVYKFGEYSTNRGYLSFVKEMSKLKNQNAFLPHIHGVRIYNAGKGHKKYFVVAMERLDPVHWRAKGAEFATIIIKEMIRSDSTNDTMQTNFLGIQIKESDDLSQAVSVVKAAHKAAQRKSQSVSYDLHNGNFMIRNNNQIVVIDPLA